MSTQFADAAIDYRQGPAVLPPRLIDRIPPIPDLKRMHGPLTARRLAISYAALAALFVVGILPSVLGMSAQWKAFGLGLVVPGGGFLFAGGVLGVAFALASVAAFLVITFIWWARGVIVGPPGVLLGTALLSAAWIEGSSGVGWMEIGIPAAVAALHGGLALRRRRTFNAARARARDWNPKITAVEPILRDFPVEAREEMPAGQVGEFRRMLDLALQPVDQWTGFPMNDTWQDGALRYQICTMSWNLSLGQYTQLPAFHGYLNTAQENLIRKHIDRKTWNYWYWESLWGNFKADKNPVHIDNIMLSGFLGVSLGMFETVSGTAPFAAPGSLTFRWDEKTAFPYSHATMLEEVVKNYQRYDYGWFPCEPRWIYSMCNLVGRTGLRFHDKRHGTYYEDAIAERFEKSMTEEMMLPDGRIKVCTSAPFGFQVPSLSGLFGETWGIRFLTPHAPEQAERLWQILKQDFMRVGADGGLDFRLLPLGWGHAQARRLLEMARTQPARHGAVGGHRDGRRGDHRRDAQDDGRALWRRDRRCHVVGRAQHGARHGQQGPARSLGERADPRGRGLSGDDRHACRHRWRGAGPGAPPGRQRGADAARLRAARAGSDLPRTPERRADRGGRAWQGRARPDARGAHRTASRARGLTDGLLHHRCLSDRAGVRDGAAMGPVLGDRPPPAGRAPGDVDRLAARHQSDARGASWRLVTAGSRARSRSSRVRRAGSVARSRRCWRSAARR